jgi:hypothetical protein
LKVWIGMPSAASHDAADGEVCPRQPTTAKPATAAAITREQDQLLYAPGAPHSLPTDTDHICAQVWPWHQLRMPERCLKNAFLPQ